MVSQSRSILSEIGELDEELYFMLTKELMIPVPENPKLAHFHR